MTMTCSSPPWVPGDGGSGLGAAEEEQKVPRTLGILLSYVSLKDHARIRIEKKMGLEAEIFLNLCLEF